MSIETFQLVKERCLMTNLNLRTEMHGEDREPACDIAFEFSSANNLLLKLHPDLRNSMYRHNETRDLVNPDHMPHLRFPLMGPVSWELEIPRTLLRVHDAEDPAHDVILGGGKTNKFKLTMSEGGTVKWHFRCQFSKPDEESVAKLMRVMNQTVPISLECADEEEKPDNFEQAEQAGKEPMSPAREKAESLFDKPAVGESDGQTAGAESPDDVVDADFDEVKPATESNVAPIGKAKRGAGARSGSAGGIE